MSQRCVAGGCSNTRSDGVSLHKWPEDPHFASLWTRAVKNTRSDFVDPINSSCLCSIHFATDSFEEQSVLAKSMGLKTKALLKYNAVPSMFDTNPPVKKETKARGRKNLLSSQVDETSAGSSKQNRQQLRGAYRKREAARVCIKRNINLSSLIEPRVLCGGSASPSDSIASLFLATTQSISRQQTHSRTRFSP